MLKTFSHNTMFDIRLLCPARIKENSNAIMIFPNHEIVFSYLRSFSMTSRTFSSSKLYSFPNAFNVLLRSKSAGKCSSSCTFLSSTPKVAMTSFHFIQPLISLVSVICATGFMLLLFASQLPLACTPTKMGKFD